MKYQFCKHVGIENIADEKKLFNRMVEVLLVTKAKVNMHILTKKERYFLCPIGLVEIDENGKLKTSVVYVSSRVEKKMELSKVQMVQIIKKAFKNYTRAKACKNN
jgi:hypothetical protein